MSLPPSRFSAFQTKSFSLPQHLVSRLNGMLCGEWYELGLSNSHTAILTPPPPKHPQWPRELANTLCWGRNRTTIVPTEQKRHQECSPVRSELGFERRSNGKIRSALLTVQYKPDTEDVSTFPDSSYL